MDAASAVNEVRADRSPYPYARLRRVFAPRSVALIGVSPRAGSFGERTLAHLEEFPGTIHLVNPGYREIAGRPCHASVAALPEVPDCAVIVTSREHVEALVRECGEAGVGGVIIYASGYAETGIAERRVQQQRLADLGREFRMCIVGPNCMGIANYAAALRLSFATFPRQPALRPAAIGVASQSGALSMSLAQAIEQHAAISHVLASGNSCDVDVADLVHYLAEDPDCKAIACVFEGMQQPQRMLAAAAHAQRQGKPLVVFKVATGEQGATAALSHTGSLAGSNAAWQAAFERCGAVVLEDFEALVETTTFFAKAPPPRAEGVAVISTSGGASIMAADKAEVRGVPLPQPAAAAHAVLEQHIPEFGSCRNPCDVTAQVIANPASLAACATALMEDPAFGAIVMPHSWAYEGAVPRMQLLGDLALLHGKPACAVWVSQWGAAPGVAECERHPGVALFRSMDSCFAALAAWHRAARRAAAPAAPAAPAVRLSPSGAAGQAAALIAQAARDTLTERESKAVLALYGIPVVEETVATDADEAVRAAAAAQGPVVLKVESPDIPHKTEAGAIRLGVQGEAAVREAFHQVLAGARRYAPDALIHGVLVQPMVPAGAEMMAGVRVDPQFGPLLVAGLGGVMVELLKDTAVRLAPLQPLDALDMLASLRGQALLDGFRGAQPVDRALLADVMVRLSEFASDQQQVLAEVDINPLICAGDRVVAVDALIVRRPVHKEPTWN